MACNPDAGRLGDTVLSRKLEVNGSEEARTGNEFILLLRNPVNQGAPARLVIIVVMP